MPLDVSQEIAALPSLVYEGGDDAATPDPNPLQVASRLGKQLLRLNISYQELSKNGEELHRQIAERDRRIEDAADRERELERQVEKMADAAVAILDALEFVADALSKYQDDTAAEAESARRDCLRRLANVGVTEIPATGIFDGNLHEGVGTVPATVTVPAYHIVEVVRRGYQRGTQILRRAEVITAK